ncbi:MAG: hypothetical protein V1899_00420, partial [Planctomycetota bacterium]
FLFATDSMNCPDGYFYARFAYRLPEHGLSKTFPWLQFTSLKDSFVDSYFLYNVLLSPFCRLASEPLVGAKIATWLLQLALLIIIYVALCRLHAPWPLFWIALLALSGPLFLSRLLMVRAHVLSMSLMVWALYAIIRQSFWGAFAVSFIYVWCYSAPIAVLCTALGAEAAQLALTGWPRRWPRLTLAVALGLVAGHLIHPYTPLTFNTLVDLLHKISAAALSGPVARISELQPFRPQDLWFGLPGITLAFMVAITGALRLRFRKNSDTKLSPESAAALGAATVWFLSIFIFKRAIEYAAPLTVIAAALVVRDWLGSRGQQPWRTLTIQSRNRLIAAIAVAVVALSISLIWSFIIVRGTLRLNRNHFASEEAWKRGRYFDGVTDWMRQNLRPGATVVNLCFDDFPELYYSAPEQYYITGMDPTLMWLAYPEEAQILENMRTRKITLDFAKLRKLFHADYLALRICRALEYPELRPGLITPLSQSGLLRPVYVGQGGLIYYLGGP